MAAKGKDLAQNEILCSKICAKGKDLAQIAAKRKDLGEKGQGANKRRFGLARAGPGWLAGSGSGCGLGPV